MVVRWQTMEMYHNRRGIGSTQIRVHNLLKHWPEAGLYQYGEKPDVLIFQKVYVTQDYKFPREYDGGLKILDICDPDWLEGMLIRQTIDAVDAITCPTQPLADFLTQMTDKPVRVIKDRFNLDDFPPRKPHKGKLKELVWFGYKHNAEALRLAMPSIINRNLNLTVISDGDPQVWRWAGFKEPDEKRYKYHKYHKDTAYKLIQKGDVVVLPKGIRPVDKYKSENKTSISRLLGMPVAFTAEELDTLIEAKDRNAYVKKWYTKTRNEFNVKRSVEEYKELIDEITSKRH